MSSAATLDIARLLARLVVWTIDRYFLPGSKTAFQKFAGPLLGEQAEKSLDERLQKIDLARDSLTEALAAMDSLKVTAEENRADLQKLEKAVRRAESQKASVQAQLDAIHKIAEIDSGSVRKVLGIPSRVDIWRERIIAFAFGVGASLIASYSWELFLKPHLPRFLGG